MSDEVGVATRLIAWKRLASTLPSYPDGTEVSEAFHRTLIQDQGDYRPEEEPSLLLQFSYSVFRRRHVRPFEEAVGYKEPVQYRLENDNSSRFAANYEQQLWDVCTQRRLIVTNKGYLRIVPASTRHGDKVAIFLGGSTPYVLRMPGRGRTYFVAIVLYMGSCMGRHCRKTIELRNWS